jgi:ubiquinone/menaquinone biosynthesis C-methylase UbiE/uncharacterized protein YbaR (Trm112 family)
MMKYLDNILICPKTKQPLKVDRENNVVTSYDKSISYPIVNNVIDFIPGVNDYITKIYDSVSPFYDKMLTGGSLPIRLLNKFVWGENGSNPPENKLLASFPDCTDKIIIDVPVGTGLFTLDHYKIIEKISTIIVVDYSMEMLMKARERYEANGIHNIQYIRGDVGNLPFLDNTADILLTMHGYQAFPEKEKALHEIVRIMKPGGTILGCFYIKNKRAISDFFVKYVYQRTGSYTPPYYNLEEIKEIWENYFEFKQYENIRSHVYFSGIKKKI